MKVIKAGMFCGLMRLKFFLSIVVMLGRKVEIVVDFASLGSVLALVRLW